MPATDAATSAETVEVTDPASLWKKHNQDPANSSLFSEGASLLYVPTGSGGKGHVAVTAFLERAHCGDDGGAAANSRVINTVVGAQSLVEESVFDDAITRGNSVWICPGADLKSVIGKRVKIPMVTVVTFSGSKIESKRVYWDQASVLAQIGFLSPAKIKNNQLPVLTDADAANLVENPNHSSYNKLSKPDVTDELKHLSAQNSRAVEEESIDVLSQGNQPVQYRLSSRVLQPGGTGGKSSVFSDEPETRRTIPADPRRYETNISFGDDIDEQQHRAPSAAALKNMNSHFQLGQSDAAVAVEEPVVTGKKVHPDKTNVSQLSFKDEEPSAGACVGTSITGTRRRPGTSNPNLVSQIGWGIETSEAAIEQPRPSSRVTRPPGGGSSIALG